ncbi:MAG: hypothetical protein GY943_28585, partial [Chloroflexi bacterium]|nr:hypothetical protein [Chloroflexota bacterium]
IGDFFTGDFQYLVFAMDDDSGTGADSTFKNIEFTAALMNESPIVETVNEVPEIDVWL